MWVWESVEEIGYERMKKPNQKTKKRRRPKKNTVARVDRKQKAANGNYKAEKAAAKIRPVNTAPKKVPERKADRGKQRKGIGYYINKSIQFLRESRTELKKVKWPSRKELLASTVMVIFLVLVVAFFLGIVDFGLIKVIKNILG